MSLIDRLEKLGRLLLWLSLVVVLVGVPLSYASQRRAEEPLRQALARAEAQVAEALKPRGPVRLQLSSMGTLLYGLNQTAATGQVEFTNVSPQSGVVCIHGTAKNPTTWKVAASLPSCREVGAYASLVKVSLAFAGGEMADVCGKAKCEFDLADVPQTEAEKVAVK